ncbi:MAG: hypothetical protein M0R03_11480 [Novosphingobium sp.]|nr:hypothetical protein [Novosphingobium sp.]
MKTLVIHPKDPSTDFLKHIYKDLLNSEVTIISDYYFERDLIKLKFDRAIILGHGTPNGLIGIYINPLLPILKKQLNNIYIWCHADEYVKKHKLTGMCTGMMVSELGEADIEGIKTTREELDHSNNLFAISIGKYINLPSKECLEKAKAEYESHDSELIKFNHLRMQYFNHFEDIVREK